ncbi:MAG: signal peptidase I [Thermoguttaceae bacterium]
MRTLTERLLGLLVILLLVRTTLLDGFPIPCQVHGGSMAETLLGPHYEVACPDCGYSFACEAAAGGGGYQTVCPSCGCPVASHEAPPEVAGDRVLIDKTAMALGGPRRWEVIAFVHPTSKGEMVVKRVVGLPGETVAIRRGDLFINDRIQRKSLRQQRAMRILVHDAGYEPAGYWPMIEPRVPSRWQGESALGSGWQATGRGFRHSAPSGEKIDWLVYKHWQRGAKPGDIRETPVTDVSSYNQGRPRRVEDVHAMADVMVSVRVSEIRGDGRLWLRATDGLEEFQVAINPGRQDYAVFRKGQEAPVAQGSLPSPLGGQTVEASLFDQQFLVAMGSRTLAAIPYDRGGGDLPSSPTPLAIGCEDLEAQLEDLEVYRDIYYGRPSSEEGAAALERGVRLGDNELFVLGDNSPISEDSRTWLDGPPVTASQIVGRPILVVFPARSYSLGGVFFQVPDPGRIRYIR